MNRRPGWLSLATTVFAAASPVWVAEHAEAQRFGLDASVWKVLAERYDANGDGKISLEEYDRGEEKFKKYDKDGDGVITDADFQRGGSRQRGNRSRTPRDPVKEMRSYVAWTADANRDSKVDVKEWKALLTKLEKNAEGGFSVEAIAKSMGASRSERMQKRRIETLSRALETNEDEKIDAADFAAIHKGLDANRDGILDESELGSFPRALIKLPKAGEVAPDFDLPYANDAKKSVKLSSFKGSKPVALIFGSYT